MFGEYKEAFLEEDEPPRLPPHREVDHKIPFIDPNFVEPRRIYKVADALVDKFNEFDRVHVAAGIWVPGTSRTASPMMPRPGSHASAGHRENYRTSHDRTFLVQPLQRTEGSASRKWPSKEIVTRPSHSIDCSSSFSAPCLEILLKSTPTTSRSYPRLGGSTNREGPRHSCDDPTEIQIRTLTQLTGNVPWRWSNICQKAFEDVKAAISSETVLVMTKKS